jgi:hypothetical protein
VILPATIKLTRYSNFARVVAPLALGAGQSLDPYVTWFTRSARAISYERQAQPHPGWDLEAAMAAIVARFLSRTFPGTQFEVETLKTLLIFCGVGLTVSLFFLLTHGLDFSVGFF